MHLLRICSIIYESTRRRIIINFHVCILIFDPREAGSVILKITYGYTAESHGRDPFVDLAGKTMENFADATVPGKWAVDVLPFREYLQVALNR